MITECGIYLPLKNAHVGQATEDIVIKCIGLLNRSIVEHLIREAPLIAVYWCSSFEPFR
jgi:hypothetical protein